jgi:lipid II:glycine glycyltransferase (peptidoglycan interpeptide bridge formation enzyme)
MIVLKANYQGDTIGAHLWFQQGEVAYSHLAAFSPIGYELMASYALYWHALEYFADKVRWLDLGAGAGVTSKANGGLSQFKRGWSSSQRTVYFCGRIFDHRNYNKIVQAKGIPSTNYFPAYRSGEF